MNSLVIRVTLHRPQDGPDRLSVGLERPPLGDGETRDLPCAPTDPEFLLVADGERMEVVRSAGDRLYEGLAGGHPDIAQAFSRITALQPGERWPIYVRFRAGSAAERIPWETIRLPDGTFLGLDSRWSVARLVDSANPQNGPRPFRPPLRIAALLSCFGIPAAEEWAGLREAVERSPVPVELLVMVGEPDLEDVIANEGLANVEVTGLRGPEDAAELRRAISTFRPHVLHFFCHGSTDQGPHLELATSVDWLQNTTEHSLFLQADEIAEFSDRIDRAWLAVLNCCEGAASHDQIHSLASDLIALRGFPAVVGMREPILSDDASSFSRSFYPALFAAVKRASEGGEEALDWSALLVDPRRGLVARRGGVFTASAAQRREWTLPVLYLGQDDFVLTTPPPTESPGGTLLLLELLRGMRAAARPTAPPGYLAELDERIAALEGGGQRD